MSTAPPPQVKSFNCPGCGAPVVIRGFGTALSVVCGNCHSVLDAKDPNFAVLQRFQVAERIQPLIPLGTRGKIRGEPYEVVGFQVRTITEQGVDYSWDEYLLFNPYKGFRYLTQYQGHWNDVTVLRTLPEVDTSGPRPVAKVLGGTFRHFQSSQARTTYVLGEFPWRVQVGGETTTCNDFVAPPRMLSEETTGSETTWSLGEYITGRQVWDAFQLPGSPPGAVGVFENQPSPYGGNLKEVWLVCALLLLALVGVAVFFTTFARNEEVFSGSYHFAPHAGQEASFVTDFFELKGRTSNVELSTRTDLSNNWAYFNYALISADTGQAFDFGREVSYYFGRDSDGAWTEGGQNDTAVVPAIPSGRYYLRVEPEMDATAAGVEYSISVRRDVPSVSYFLIAALLLLVPPVFLMFRSMGFEQARWRESDYTPAGSSASGGDDN
ncbi:MAG: DUF4178 domain-containing protein [Bryobacteraceae bacterium]|jgi:hypothetical protein